MQNDAGDIMAEYPGFIYDDKRLCQRVFLFIKTVGLAFYTTTISMCNFKSMDLHIVIILAFMFLSIIASICNSLRYEYVLYLRYDTVFESYTELMAWKAGLRPNLALAFSGIEMTIKLIFLIFSLPLEITFYERARDLSKTNTTMPSICESGKSILKIHILVALAIYAVAIIFTAFLFVSFLSLPGERQPNQRQQHQPQPRPMLLQGPLPLYPETECCICLDKTYQPWITMPCAHSFHYTCISEWVARNPSCPVCRMPIPVPVSFA